MIVGRFFGTIGRGPDVAAVIPAAIGVTMVPRPANAGGISPGAAVGIGLGAFRAWRRAREPLLLKPVTGIYSPSVLFACGV